MPAVLHLLEFSILLYFYFYFYFLCFYVCVLLLRAKTLDPSTSLKKKRETTTSPLRQPEVKQLLITCEILKIIRGITLRRPNAGSMATDLETILISG